MTTFAKGLSRTRQTNRAPQDRTRQRRLRSSPAGSAGVLVWTPGMVQSYMDATNEGVVATGKEIHRWLLAKNRQEPERTADWQHLNVAWGKFAKNWGAFYQEGSSRLWGGYQDVQRAHAWRLKLVEWRKIFASHGLRFLGAGPVTRMPGRAVMRDVLVGVGGAVATFYVMKLLKKGSR